MNENMLDTMKQQNLWMKLTAIFMGGVFLVILVSALILVPRASSVMTNAQATLEEANLAIADVNAAAEELNKTAEQLAEIDFKSLVSDTQKMVNEGSEGIAQAIGKLDEIDIAGLNQAIADLETVVSPLARLFGN